MCGMGKLIFAVLFRSIDQTDICEIAFDAEDANSSLAFPARGAVSRAATSTFCTPFFLSFARLFNVFLSSLSFLFVFVYFFPLLFWRCVTGGTHAADSAVAATVFAVSVVRGRRGTCEYSFKAKFKIDSNNKILQ